MRPPAKALAALVPLAAVAALFILARAERAARASKHIVLVLSGDLRGRLEPCGCAKELLGGLPRRASYLARLRAEGAAVLALDAGELVQGADRKAETALETALDLHRAMGTAALVLGDAEAAFGAERVAALARDRGIEPLAPGAVRTIRAGRARIGVLALPREGAGEALAAGREALRAAGDYRVAFLRGDARAAEAAAEAAPGAADLLVFGGEEDLPAYEARRAGGALLGTYGALGKALGRVDVVLGAPGEPPEDRFRWVPLDASIPDDPGALAALDLRQERLRAERLVETLPRTPDPRGTFVGSASCSGCHAAAYEVWRGSRHAGALPTLEKARRDADPDCVLCHVVGLGREGGFVSRAATPDLAGVGCESCHGPGLAHAANPRVALERGGEASCLGCHDAEHRPGFGFAEAWPRIAHR